MSRRESFLLGQDHVVRALSAAIRRDRLAHGLLFVGPDGVGRERTARGLASALLCENDDDTVRIPFGCGECRGCRRIESNTHPDVHHLLSDAEATARGAKDPEKKIASRDIRVEQVRELALQMRRAPYEGKARVAIVTDAHRMNTSAQNALLKTLEEPGPASLLVLVAPHSRSVLPTIESRCQRIRFSPLTTDVVQKIGARLGATDALAALGNADAESMNDLLGEGDARISDRAAAQEFLDELYESSASERVDLVEKVGRDRGTVDALLKMAHAISVAKLRDAAQHGAADVDGRPADLVLHVAGALQTTRRALAANAHVQIVLEDLALRLCPPAPGR